MQTDAIYVIVQNLRLEVLASRMRQGRQASSILGEQRPTELEILGTARSTAFCSCFFAPSPEGGGRGRDEGRRGRPYRGSARLGRQRRRRRKAETKEGAGPQESDEAPFFAALRLERKAKLLKQAEELRRSDLLRGVLAPLKSVESPEAEARTDEAKAGRGACFEQHL